MEEGVVEALEEMAGLPAVAFSKLPVLPGVQVHDDDDSGKNYRLKCLLCFPYMYR